MSGPILISYCPICYYHGAFSFLESPMNWRVPAVLSLAVLAIVACAGVAPIASSPAGSSSGSPIIITVNVDQPGARINPAMWGVFFEDINFGADGGLYAEMVKNRSFEFPEPLMGWSK